MQTQYNVKETALRFASFEPDTEKQSRGFQVNEASDVIDHVLLAKRIKLRYSAFIRARSEATLHRMISV